MSSQPALPTRISRFPSTSIALTALLLCSSAYSAPPTETTDQLIVRFDSPSAAGNLRAIGLSRTINQRLTHQRRTAGGADVYKLDQHQQLAQVRGLATALEAVSGVSYAEADQLLQPVLVAPDDQFYGSAQWHYQAGPGGIDAPSAWAAFDPTTTTPVYVAVLDTGYRPHVDLVDNLVDGADLIDDSVVANDGDGRDMDALDPGDWTLSNGCGGGSPARNSSWHGTHVSGTIAASTHNGSGVAGVTYNMAKVVPVRVLGRCGGYLSDIADGIRWAIGQPVSGLADNAHPARVINMSLGGSGSCGTTYQNAINSAVTAGASVVVSAGNSNADAGSFRPANCDNVISIAATNIDGGRSYYSNYGAVVDLAAPGGEMNADATKGIASTLNDGDQAPGDDIYVYYQGTSMAAPHVSGIAALMLLKNPSLTPSEVEAVLISSSRPFPAGCSGCGAGIVHAGAAVAAASGGEIPTAPTSPQLTSVIDNQNGSATLFWNDSDNEEQYQIQRQQKNKRKWSGWADIGTAAADQISYTDQSGSGTFRYQIRASNSFSVSSWSTSSEVTVSDTGSDSGGGDKPIKLCRGRNC